MAAGKVRLPLELVPRRAEQPFLVIELECGLVPGDDAVADLVRLGQSGPWLRLTQVHQRDPLAV